MRYRTDRTKSPPLGVVVACYNWTEKRRSEREWTEKRRRRESGPKSVVLEREWTEKRRQSRSAILKLVFTRFYAACR